MSNQTATRTLTQIRQDWISPRPEIPADAVLDVVSLLAIIDEMAKAFRAVHRNDATQYEHHQPRNFDKKPPEEAGSTRWFEPKEIAFRTLRRHSLPTIHDVKD